LKQQDFEKQHSALWQRFDEAVASKANSEALQSLPSDYQRISHHLAMAKQRRYSGHLIQRLNTLVTEGHKHLYRDLPRAKANFLYFLVAGFPQVVRKNASFVWFALALFYLPGLLFFFLCFLEPDLIYSLMSYAQVQEFERV